MFRIFPKRFKLVVIQKEMDNMIGFVIAKFIIPNERDIFKIDFASFDFWYPKNVRCRELIAKE